MMKGLRFQQKKPTFSIRDGVNYIPLYTEPPKRNPMTRDEALKIVAANPDAMTAVRMTEAAHGIKELNT